MLTPKQREDITVTALRAASRIEDQDRDEDRGREKPLRARCVEVTITVHLEPGQGKGHLTYTLMADLDTIEHQASGLDREEREWLFKIAWETQKAESKPPAVQRLIARGFVRHIGATYSITPTGKEALSPMARQALHRPRNYATLSEAARWSIDKELGILDWDGS